MERFAKLAAESLQKVLSMPIGATDLEVPPDPKLGDFAFPCFKLAKQFRKGPPQLAQQIAADIQAKGELASGLSVAPVGPYVNFTVAPEQVVRTLLGDILAGSGLGNYGSLPSKTRGS